MTMPDHVLTFSVARPEGPPEPRVELLLEGNRGRYIPRDFADEWEHGWTYEPRHNETAKEAALRWDADMRYLREGPDQEFYWEVWGDVLENAVGKAYLHPLFLGCIEGDNPFRRYRLHQDGDLWAYHPDDADEVFADCP